MKVILLAENHERVREYSKRYNFDPTPYRIITSSSELWDALRGTIGTPVAIISTSPTGVNVPMPPQCWPALRRTRAEVMKVR